MKCLMAAQDDVCIRSQLAEEGTLDAVTLERRFVIFDVRCRVADILTLMSKLMLGGKRARGKGRCCRVHAHDFSLWP